MTFEEFANLCLDEPKHLADYHYLPQWDLLSFDGVRIPQILFKMTQFNELESFLTGLGFDISTMGHSNHTHRKMDFMDRYTPELKAKAEAYYIDDIKQFRYD